MLIEFKVKTELPIVLLLLHSFEWFKQISDIIHGEQRTTQDSHDFHDRTTDFHVMFDDANEAICDNGNMYLNTDSILRLSPKGLDAEMLLDPLEEQFNLPPVFIKESNVFSFKIEVVCVICEGASKLWREVNDASDSCWIIRFVPLACETNSLVTEDIFFSFLKVNSALYLISRMKLLSNDKECSRAMDFVEPCKVKVPSIKHIACERLVCKPVHGVDIMYLSVGDSVEYGNLRNDVNLRVDSYSKFGRSELRPSENGQAEINCCGVNCIESPMQFKLSGKAFRLSNRHHVKSKLFKDSIISNGVRFGKNLSVDKAFSKAEKERFVSMGDCNICKFSETSTSKQLSEHKNQQMVPMGKRPTSCAVIVLDRQSFEVPLRKELGYLRKNIVTRMHICSNFDLDAKVRISKVRQGFRNLCNCA